MAVADYYDDVRDELTPVSSSPSDDDRFVDPERLAEILEQPSETARQVLRLLDGMETFTTPPAFPEPELLLPSVGIEGFQDALSDLWERIKRWLAAVRRWLLDDSRHAHLALQTVKLQAENLKIEGRGIITHTQGGKIEINGRIPSISVFYKPPPDVGTLISNVRFMNSVMASYLDYVDGHLLGKVGRISGRILQLDPLELYSGQLSDLHDEILAAGPSALLGRMRFTEMPGGVNQYSSPHLTGNMRLIYRRTNNEPTLHGVSSQSVRLTHSAVNPRPIPKQITLGRFGRVQHEQLTNHVLELTERLLHHTDGPMRKRRERSLDDISRAVERFSGSVQHLPEDQLRQKEQIRQVVQLARTITEWMHNPYHGMIANTTKTLRGALMVCRANLA